jgi:hypothetical protein
MLNAVQTLESDKVRPCFVCLEAVAGVRCPGCCGEGHQLGALAAAAKGIS